MSFVNAVPPATVASAHPAHAYRTSRRAAETGVILINADDVFAHPSLDDERRRIRLIEHLARAERLQTVRRMLERKLRLSGYTGRLPSEKDATDLIDGGGRF